MSIYLVLLLINWNFGKTIGIFILTKTNLWQEKGLEQSNCFQYSLSVTTGA